MAQPDLTAPTAISQENTCEALCVADDQDMPLSATFVGAVFTLLIILCFYAYRQIERERERMLADLRLKGTILIHSLEAGARVGMVGMWWGRQQLQLLLRDLRTLKALQQRVERTERLC